MNIKTNVINYQDESMVGLKIRTRRKYLGLTQKELGELTSLSCQQVQKYESGGSRLSIPMIMKMCKALEVKPGYFFEMDPGDELLLEANEDIDKTLIRLFKRIQNKKIKFRIFELLTAMIEEQEKD